MISLRNTVIVCCKGGVSIVALHFVDIIPSRAPFITVYAEFGLGLAVIPPFYLGSIKHRLLPLQCQDSRCTVDSSFLVHRSQIEQ